MQYLGVSVSAVIAAPIEALWEVVADVTRHAELAGSGEVQQVELLQPGPLQEGALFRAQQKMRGLEYATVSRVVVWAPPLRFAWRVGLDGAAGIAQIWQFALMPEAGGTRVENSVTLPYAIPAFWPFTPLRALVARNEAATMRPTLINLAQVVGAPAPTVFAERQEPPAETAALLPPPLLQAIPWVAGAALLASAALRRRPA